MGKRYPLSVRVVNKKRDSDMEAFMNTLKDMGVLSYKRKEGFHIVSLNRQYMDLSLSIAAVFLSRYVGKDELAFLSYTVQGTEALLVGRRLAEWPNIIPRDSLTRLVNIRDILDRPGSPQNKKCAYCPLRKYLELGMSLTYCRWDEVVENDLQSLCYTWRTHKMTTCAECKDFLANIIVSEPEGPLARTLLRALGFDLCEKWDFPPKLLHPLLAESAKHDDAFLSAFVAITATIELGELNIAVGAKVKCGRHSIDPELVIQHNDRYLFVELHASRQSPSEDRHFYDKQGRFLAVSSNAAKPMNMLYFHISDQIDDVEEDRVTEHCTRILIPRDSVFRGPKTVVKELLVPKLVQALRELRGLSADRRKK